MSSANPTPLPLGAAGTLEGKRWRVAGRVVLGVEVDGETYQWNEFNLVDGFGRNATLVFEETEAGPAWKFFNSCEPLRPLSAAEAETKRVGDAVNLDGTPRPITLVDESRVVHVEGKAPDGVEVGDVARYFNIETGTRMLVASWTGDEIEFFEGNGIPGASVAAAFGLPAGAAAFVAGANAAYADTGASASGGSTLKFTGAGIIALIALGVFLSGRCQRSTPARSVPPAAIQKIAPTFRPALGAKGSLGQQSYTVAARAIVEIDRVGARQERPEYALVSDTGSPALLIAGLNSGAKEWHLFLPVTATGTLAALTPYDAAALRRGAPIVLGDRTLHVSELFQSQRRSLEGTGGDAIWPPLHYGFVARDGDLVLLARWTENGIQFHRGSTIAETEVVRAFTTAEKK